MQIQPALTNHIKNTLFKSDELALKDTNTMTSEPDIAISETEVTPLQKEDNIDYYNQEKKRSSSGTILATLGILASLGIAGIAIYKNKSAKNEAQQALKKLEELENKNKATDAAIQEARDSANSAIEKVNKLEAMIKKAFSNFDKKLTQAANNIKQTIKPEENKPSIFTRIGNWFKKLFDSPAEETIIKPKPINPKPENPKPIHIIEKPKQKVIVKIKNIFINIFNPQRNVNINIVDKPIAQQKPNKPSVFKRFRNWFSNLFNKKNIDNPIKKPAVKPTPEPIVKPVNPEQPKNNVISDKPSLFTRFGNWLKNIFKRNKNIEKPTPEPQKEPRISIIIKTKNFFITIINKFNFGKKKPDIIQKPHEKFFDKGAKEGVEYLEREETLRKAETEASDRRNQIWQEHIHQDKEKEYNELFKNVDKKQKQQKPHEKFFTRGAKKGLKYLEHEETLRKAETEASDRRNQIWQEHIHQDKEKEYNELFKNIEEIKPEKKTRKIKKNKV